MVNLEQKIKAEKKMKRFDRILSYIIAGSIAASGAYYGITHPDKVQSAYEAVHDYVVGK